MSDAKQVLRQLTDAVARGDGERFFSICRENAQVIFDNFHEWRVVPEEIRSQPEEIQKYFNALVETARLFEGSGYPQLMELLMPDEEENPLTQWQDRFNRARQLAGAGEYESALAEAERLLEDLTQSGASGPALTDLRAKLEGLRGECLFMLERYDEAREATTLALEECERNGDAEGVRIYRENLATIEVHAPARPELVDAEINVLESFTHAQRLTDLRRFKASNDIFERLLAAAGDAAEVVQKIRPHILGRMGFNEFKLGNKDAARALIESARDLCSERGDGEGAEVYAENLLALEGGQYGGASPAGGSAE